MELYDHYALQHPLPNGSRKFGEGGAWCDAFDR